MPLLRLPALPRNIYTSGMGWTDRTTAGVSALWEATDNVGAANWGVSEGSDPCPRPRTGRFRSRVGALRLGGSHADPHKKLR